VQQQLVVLLLEPLVVQLAPLVVQLAPLAQLAQHLVVALLVVVPQELQAQLVLLA
jgi:hypothetical protein